MKALQWNIGGGYVRNEGDDPRAGDVYSHTDLPYIVEHIRGLSPDIITLQEAHANASGSQAATIAKELNYNYANHSYDDSHIEQGQRLSVAVLVKGTLLDDKFSLFYNPKFKGGPEGAQWTSHDKGVLSCMVELSMGQKLQVKTLHMIPYKKFGLELSDESVLRVLADADEKFGQIEEPFLFQGDFNINDSSLRNYFSQLFSQGVMEIVESRPTTPGGNNYDHVLYKGLRPKQSQILSTVRTDHYIVFSEFEF